MMVLARQGLAADRSARLQGLARDAAMSSTHIEMSMTGTMPPVDVPPLPKRKILAFGLGHVLNDLCAACWFSYLLVLMHTVLGLKPVESATILLSGQIADAIATPLVGIYSDKASGVTVCGFYIGRRHLFYSLGTVLVIVNFFALFARCILCDILGTDEQHSSETGVVIYYSFAAAFFNVGWASVQVSHLSMVPELTSDETTRVVLNSVRYSATVCSNLFVFALLAVLIDAFSLGKEQQFHVLALTALGVGVFTSIVFLLGTEEKRPKEEQMEYDAEQRKKTAAAAASAGGEGNLNVNEDYYRLVDDEEQPKRTVVQSADSAPVVPPSPSHTQQTQETQPTTTTVTSVRVSPLPAGASALGSRTSSGGSAGRVNGPARGQTVLDEGEESLSEVDVIDPYEQSFSLSTSQPAGVDDCDLESTLARQLNTLPVIFRSWRCWFNQPEYFVCWAIYVCTRVVVNVSQVCLPFYVLDVIQFPTLYITILPCTVYTSSLIASAFMKTAHLRFGRKTVFCVGFLLVILGSLGMLFLPSSEGQNSWQSFLLFPCSVGIGLGNGIAMISCGALVAEMIGSRTNHAAFVFGSFSFGDKLVTGVILFLLQTFNQDSSAYWRVAATFPPIVAALFACGLLIFKVDLKEWRRKHTVSPAGAARGKRRGGGYRGSRTRARRHRGSQSKSAVESLSEEYDLDQDDPPSTMTASLHGDGSGGVSSDHDDADSTATASLTMPRSVRGALAMLGSAPGSAMIASIGSPEEEEEEDLYR